MSKKIKIYQWASYFIMMLISSLIGFCFILKAREYAMLYLEWFITPLAIIIVLFIVGIISFFNNLRYTHNHLSSFHYLQTQVMPHLFITHEDHQKAIELFESYMLKAYTINTLFKILIILTGFFSIFFIDFAVYIYDSYLLLIIDIILTYLVILIFLALTNLILTKYYKKFVLSHLDDNNYIFVDFSYIYLCHNFASLPCPFSYKMNIAVGLSKLGEYEHANIYLKRLWNEEKRLTTSKTFQLSYYYNCYIFSLRLHLSDANQYKDKVNHLMSSHPRLCQAKSTQFIPKRIQIEEEFSHQEWNLVIEHIQSLIQEDISNHLVYYQFLLYIAYLHINEIEKSNLIYNQYKDNIHFQKLVKLETEAIN